MMSATRATDAFVDLICADDELVRAEFDALMRDCWPADTPGSAPLPPAPRPRNNRHPNHAARIRPGSGNVLAARRSAGERAPPAAHHRREPRRT